MPSDQSPTVRRRRLGAELKRLREEAGVTRDQAAERLDSWASKISRIEIGRSGIRKIDLEALLDLYRVDDQRLRDALVRLVRDGRKRGWWSDQKGVLDHVFFDFVTMEGEAEQLRSFENHVVPGLFQTEDYVRALCTGAGTHDGTVADGIVERRMERQKVLVREQPPHVTTVVHEAALHVMVGGAKVMKDQLLRLTEINDPQQSSIQVLPNVHGAHPGVEGSFLIVSYPDPVDWDVVFVDYMLGGTYVEEPGQVRQYCRTFEHLRSVALSSPQSNDLILRIARDLDR
ncbi:helix-turn-helix transcriptional regulator [Streptomyces pathocidini]|uniref:helix-turn-helix domain-containing protein n=1 Tax=Streptomyces pathocidini TaxID=1650571 RepID=UPI0033C19F98